jgi:hypothetical protein
VSFHGWKIMLDFQKIYVIVCMARVIPEEPDISTGLPYNYIREILERYLK